MADCYNRSNPRASTTPHRVEPDDEGDGGVEPVDAVHCIDDRSGDGDPHRSSRIGSGIEEHCAHVQVFVASPVASQYERPG